MFKQFKNDAKKASAYVLKEFSVFQMLRADIALLKSHCQDMMSASSDIEKIKFHLGEFQGILSGHDTTAHELREELNVLMNTAVSESRVKKIYDTVIEFNKKTNPTYDERKENFKYFVIVDAVFQDISNIIKNARAYAQYANASIASRLGSIKEKIGKNQNALSEIYALDEMLGKYGEWLDLISKDYDKSEKILNQVVFSSSPESFRFRFKKVYFPKSDHTFKVDKHDVRLIVKFDPKLDKSHLEDLFNLFLSNINELLNKNPQLFELDAFSYMKKRFTTKIFQDPKKSNKYALALIEDAMKTLLTHNKELLISSSMTYIINIVAESKIGLDNAFYSPGFNSAYNVRAINIGFIYLYKFVLFSKDFYTPIDSRLISHIQSTPLSNDYLKNLFSNSSGQFFSGEKYRNTTFYTTLYHEFVHSTDFSMEKEAVYTVFPEVVKELEHRHWISPKLGELNSFFMRSRSEALTVFSEFFVKISSDKYYDNMFVSSLPLKMTTTRILSHFKNISSNLHLLIPSSMESIYPDVGKGLPYEYESGYMMSIILLLNYLFKNDSDALIISKNEFIDVAGKNFPYALDYILGKSSGEIPIKENEMLDTDKLLAAAYNGNDSSTMKKILSENGITIITKDNFKKFYDKNTTFLIHKPNKEKVMVIFNLIRLSGVGLYALYKKACEELSIECIFDDAHVGKSILEAVKLYNDKMKKEINKMP